MSAQSPGRAPRKKAVIILGAVVGVVIAVLAASFIYAKVINKADKALDQSTIDSLLAATTTSTAPATSAPGSTSPATTAPATSAPAAGADGTWTAAADSILGYRVKESINGFDTEANGRTSAVTGSLTIAGTSATAAQFTVDMTTFKSDEGRRDGQFNGRIMAVDQFPTATFVLTQPIDFGAVPADGSITTNATGDLTLRGVTKSVTFELSATYRNGRIAVLGNIPVVFADYGIPNPSIATIVTEDNGLLEFALVFDRAG
ncbi:MAG: YceI family protein [Acidobacteria bacterium]|nr:YceI family protein [Acidobacteriota bacterium]